VRFHDLTGVFQSFAGEAYVDDCCHLTRVGNRLLAGEIGRLLARELAASPPRRGGEAGRDGEPRPGHEQRPPSLGQPSPPDDALGYAASREAAP
jgi:hypothetical protein